ncbi:bacterio-opsin activator domain-containing protein [Halobaculum sp. MBLA0147]|uniref:bacterio-opsin activator domain-containing protein n=1 Tax=Halobaculum sp. MBLA0147 TaxID=3079934 RepID=UPI0035231221
MESLSGCPVGVLDVTAAGRVAAANDTVVEVLDTDHDTLAEAHVDDVFPHSVERTLPRAFADADGDPTAHEFEEYYPGLERWLAVTVDPDAVDDGARVYVDDVTDRRSRRREAEALRAELDQMAVISELVSEILVELVGATTREGIAETVVRRLGETDRYEFAWFGEREIGGDDVVIRASAGTTDDTIDCVRQSLDGDAVGPEERAMETGEVRLVAPVADDPSVPEPVRQTAFANGLQSLLSIPLVYGDTVYGIVGVYATEEEAFSGRERASFETLGQVAGFAINAARHRNLLLSDTVTELTLEYSAANCPLADVSASFDTDVALDGVVPQDGGGLLCYVTTADADAETVADDLAECEGVVRTRVVAEGTGGSVEVEFTGGTPLVAASSLGGTIQSATYADGRGEMIVELSPSEDVRRISETIKREFDANLAAKQQRERSVTTERDVQDALGDRLTDKQEEALRTAFFADYFESPRGSTAEEVATSLDITAPTLLYHLRAGQRKLLSSFFEESRERTLDEAD